MIPTPRPVLLALLFASALFFVSCDDDDGTTGGMNATRSFDVTIENVGTPTPLLKSGAFTTPIGASQAGPLMPGDAYEISFTAGPNEVPGTGMRFSFATMFIQSNDLFYAFEPGGIALFDDNGTPGNERDDTPIGQGTPVDVTDRVFLWDAGTEVDEEPGTGPNQAPRQSGANTGDAENGDLVRVTDSDMDGRLDDSGFELPAVDETIKVTVASEEDASTGAIRFTIRIENVGTGDQINGQPNLISPGAFAAHFDQVPATGDEVAFFVADAPESQSIDGIEEIAEDGDPSARGQAAGSLTGVTVPLSPGAYAVHTDAVQLFTVGQPAGAGIVGIAEDGAPGDLAASVMNLDGVSGGGAFGQAPIAPTGPNADNQRYTFTVEATPGDRLSFATMYIQSNDLFYATAPEGIALFDANGSPIQGVQLVELYDAGSEGDQEPGAGLDQAPRQQGPNTGPDGEGLVALVTDTDGDGRPDNDGFSYAPTSEVIRVTTTPR